MPSYNRLGPHDCHRIKNGRREPIYQCEDKSIERFEGRALGCAATQYIQLGGPDRPRPSHAIFHRTLEMAENGPIFGAASPRVGHYLAIC